MSVNSTSTYERQNAAIRNVRNTYPGVGQRTLAAKILAGDYPGSGQYTDATGKTRYDFNGRTFASVYGVIRRHDATARQVANVPQVS